MWACPWPMNFSPLKTRNPLSSFRLLLCLIPVSVIFALVMTGCSGGDLVAKAGKVTVTGGELKDELIKRYRTAEFAAQRTLEERKEVVKSLLDQRMKVLEAYRLGLDQDSVTQKAAEDARLQAAIQELYKVDIMDKVIPPSELRKQYDKMGEEIKASHILFKTPMDAAPGELETAKAKADSICNLLKNGANFDSLARQLSEDATTAQNGGDLGYFGWGRMVDEFQEAAFALKKGEISKPAKSTYGYHVIKLVDRRPNTNRKSFEEEQESIRTQLRRKYQTDLNKAAEEYLNKLKEENGLKYNYANIQKVLDKVNNPASPQNNSLFSNFTEEEKGWEIASLKTRTLLVKDLEAELSKTGMPPHWRDQKAVTSAVERMLIPEFLGDKAKAKGLYKSPDVDKAYKTAIESRMLQMVESKQVEEKINLSDSTLLSYYQNHLSEFQTDSTAEVQEIYVTVDQTKNKDLAFAQNLANRAKRGEDFTKLVQKYTDRKSALNREGKIGPLTSRQYGEMGKTAFRLQVGQISDPIPMGPRAFSIIKVLSLTPPRVKTFEEAKPQVERQIRLAQSDSLRNAWKADMEKRYPTTIYDKRLMSILPMPTQSDSAKAKTTPAKGNEPAPQMKLKQTTPIQTKPPQEKKP